LLHLAQAEAIRSEVFFLLFDGTSSIVVDVKLGLAGCPSKSGEIGVDMVHAELGRSSNQDGAIAVAVSPRYTQSLGCRLVEMYSEFLGRPRFAGVPHPYFAPRSADQRRLPLSLSPGGTHVGRSSAHVKGRFPNTFSLKGIVISSGRHGDDYPYRPNIDFRATVTRTTILHFSRYSLPVYNFSSGQIKATLFEVIIHRPLKFGVQVHKRVRVLCEDVCKTDALDTNEERG
jgi:hypothetical protein